jgi:calcineurin-like phosphoesterase family protein
MKLTLSKGQKLWFTSDTHYNHTNICSATTKWKDPVTCREFTSLAQMNSHLICNINEVVEQDDILFHLGDWSFGGFEQVEKFRESIFCKNIHLVLGNHDHHIKNNVENCKDLFSSVNDYLDLSVVSLNRRNEEIKVGRFILMHYPIASWNDMARNTVHLHGHVHFDESKKFGLGKMLDVGCDGNDLYPIEMKQVLQLMGIQPIKSMFDFDHHEIVENYK